MADHVYSRRWSFRALFAALCILIIFARLLPLDPVPGGVPGPDLILLFAFCWVLRRPDYVPVLLIAAVLLLTDILFVRPLGLWTALAVLATEFLRTREPNSRDLPFLAEWGLVGVALVGMTGANALILAMFGVDQPGLGLVLSQLVVTLASYPVVVLISAKVFGLRKMAPGQVDQLGHRL